MDNGHDGGMRETERISPDDLELLQQAREPRGGIALLLYHHRDGVIYRRLTRDRDLIIGRNPTRGPDNLALNDPSLSREHARFTLRDNVVEVQDLGSRNGTWLRNEQVLRVNVVPGDELRLSAMPVVILAGAQPPCFRRVLSHEGFRLAIEDEVVRARHFRRQFALLMVRAEGPDARHVASFHASVAQQLRPVDRMALYSPDTLEILAPEAGPEDARQLADMIAALSLGRTPDLLVGVASFPDVASEPEALLDECRKAMLSAGEGARVRVAPGGTRTSERRGRASAGAEAVVVASDATRRVFSQVASLGRSSIPVLILGETGVGKEVVAQRIHAQSARKTKPLVVVNCAAIPETLIEAMLFGHQRGAFTGATHQQKGLFEAADGGTLMLDEIGDLPKASQAALLRVLETGRVRRVGASDEVDVDVRILAATHRDLEAMCARGEFRSDLLYRVSGVTVTVPALRDRVEEIEALTQSFLSRANDTNGRSVSGVSPEAMALLKAYTWPGNVRELRNAVERAVVLTQAEWIRPEDLPERVVQSVGAAAEDPRAPEARSSAPPAPVEEVTPVEDAAGDEVVSLKERVARYESEQIVRALNATGGNQRQAAELLGLPLRTLVHKLTTYGIKRPPYKLGGPPTKP